MNDDPLTPPVSPQPPTLPHFVAPDHRDNYLAGWQAGKRAATVPLSDEIARDVVHILSNEHPSISQLKDAG
jgi:hypothetical protein